MVLDDLGLVPTLRRSARDRGQRAGVDRGIRLDGHRPAAADGARERAVPDPRRGARRLPRCRRRIASRSALDWTDERVEGRVSAIRDRTSAVERRRARGRPAQASAEPGQGKDLPPALAAMIEDRREKAEAAAETARNAAIVALPATAWREIQQRAATVGDRGGADAPAARSCGSAWTCQPDEPA